MPHTPGPWNQIVKMDGFTAVGAKTLIARVFSEAFRGAGNERANANLIAAAPDLLEALKECLAQGGSSDDEWLPIKSYRKAEAAIAKAEGRE